MFYWAVVGQESAQGGCGKVFWVLIDEMRCTYRYKLPGWILSHKGYSGGEVGFKVYFFLTMLPFLYSTKTQSYWHLKQNRMEITFTQEILLIPQSHGQVAHSADLVIFISAPFGLQVGPSA